MNAIFEHEYIVNFGNHFENTINSVFTDPQLTASQAPIMRDTEHALVCSWIERVHFESNEEPFIHKRFAEQVRRTPSTIAVVQDLADGSQLKLSYQQLDHHSTRLAHSLLLCLNEIERPSGIFLYLFYM